MNRVAMIAVLVGLSAAPAFAASQSNNSQPVNPPAQQSGTLAQNAASMDRSADRETKALNMLEAKGYADFTNFHRVRPGVFTASVDRNGHWSSVQIDPGDNQIMRG